MVVCLFDGKDASESWMGIHADSCEKVLCCPCGLFGERSELGHKKWLGRCARVITATFNAEEEELAAHHHLTWKPAIGKPQRKDGIPTLRIEW